MKKLKYAIVGNRRGYSQKYVHKILCKHKVSTTAKLIISGGAEGVDTYAQNFAKLIGVPILIYYPNHIFSSPEKYFLRNKQIAESCDVLIAFDKEGKSGTKNTIKYAKKLGKRIVLLKRRSK